jgi:cell division protein FtsB
MVKTILKYGLGCGIIVALYLNIGYELGLMYRSDWLRYLVYLGIIIHPLAVLFALLELKRKQYAGKLPIVPAISTGILTSLIAGLLYCLFTYIDIHWLDFRQYQETIDYSVAEMEKQGKSQAEINEAVKQMKAKYLSYRPYWGVMKWYMKMGALYTIVSYILLNIKTLKNKLHEKTKTTENKHST